MLKLQFLRRPPVVAAFVVVLAATGIGGTHYTSRTSFCGACHEMQAPHAGWAASAHAGTHCYACHADKGVFGTASAKAQGLRELVVHFTRPVDMDQVKATVPASRCVACHAMTDRAKYGERVALAHRKHLEAKLDCLACHTAVGHTRERFDGFGSAACTSCHSTKPQAKRSTYIHKTPCLRPNAQTTATAVALPAKP